MNLTPGDIAEFKKLYQRHFNVELDDDEARHKLSLLVRQMEIVHRPVTKEQLEDLVIDDVRKRDAHALAQLIYDIYQDKLHAENGSTNG